MTILNGYTSQATAYEVKDYPYGFTLRTSIFYWIETKQGKGDRFCSYTINPKTGRANKPKYDTYYTFLYMYLNEDNHVKHGGIDSYNHDIFVARFQFILDKIGVQYLSETQKLNIRVNHYQHMVANAPYEAVKYSADKKPGFYAWLTDTAKHIKTCDFADLVNYPDKPEFDQPNEEIKCTMTIS